MLRLHRQVLPILTSRPGALLPCLPSPSCLLQQRFPYSPPTPLFGILCVSRIRDARRFRAPVLLLYVAPGREPFGCFERIPRHPLSRPLCCMDPSVWFQLQHCRRKSPMEPSGCIETRRGSRLSGFLASFSGDRLVQVFPAGAVCANIIRLGVIAPALLRCAYIAPAQESRRFDACYDIEARVTFRLKRFMKMTRLFNPKSSRKSANFFVLVLACCVLRGHMGFFIIWYYANQFYFSRNELIGRGLELPN